MIPNDKKTKQDLITPPLINWKLAKKVLTRFERLSAISSVKKSAANLVHFSGT